MSSLSLLALEHQRKRNELSDRVARRAVRLWRSVSSGNLDAGWDAVAPSLVSIVAVGQFQAASMASRYTSAAFGAQGMVSEPARVVTDAFTGVTLDGREVGPELYTSVTTTKSLIGRGVGVGAAFQAGTALMSILAATMVRDAGNMADKVSSVGRGTVQMARVLSPGACSRCAILAGVGNFSKHFERHPRCRCSTVPVRSGEPVSDGIFDSAGAYFNSLSEAEQDRTFTKSGAEAIRLGASEASVVNSRSGMYRTRQPGSLVARATQRTLIGPDGKPFQAFVTSANRLRAGSPFRVDASRRTSQVRLMPETIMSLAGGDPARAVELLRQYGYLY